MSELKLTERERKFVLDACNEAIDEYETDGSCRDYIAARDVKAKIETPGGQVGGLYGRNLTEQEGGKAKRMEYQGFSGGLIFAKERGKSEQFAVASDGTPVKISEAKPEAPAPQPESELLQVARLIDDLIQTHFSHMGSWNADKSGHHHGVPGTHFDKLKALRERLHSVLERESRPSRSIEEVVESFIAPLYPYKLDNGCYDTNDTNWNKIRQIHHADLHSLIVKIVRYCKEQGL